MSQNAAVWVLIVLSFVAANMPMYLTKPLLFLPWQLKGEPARPAGLRYVLFIAYTGLLVAVGWGIHAVLSQTFFVSLTQLLVAALVFMVVMVAVFAIPVWSYRHHIIEKSFFARLLETTALYGFMGLLGVGFESSLGNVFPQGWEFYVITYCLFAILAYPGFVLRYLLKRRRVLVPQKA